MGEDRYWTSKRLGIVFAIATPFGLLTAGSADPAVIGGTIAGVWAAMLLLVSVIRGGLNALRRLAAKVT